MQRARRARELAQALFTAEDALDAAIRDFARLTAAMMDARAEMGLSTTVGCGVVTRAAAVQASLAQARSEAAALHAELSEVKDGIGLRAVAVGAGDKTDRKPGAQGPFTDASAPAPARTLRAG